MSNIQKTILGCIVLDNSIHDQVIPLIKPEYFDSKNKYLFEKMLTLYKKSQPIDAITLYQTIGKNSHWTPVELAQLSDGIGSTANVLSYVQSLKFEYVRRELKKKCNIEVDEWDDPTTELSKIIKELEGIQNESVISHSRSLVDILDQAVNEMTTEKNTVGLIGVPTPITKLNADTRGFRKGELIVVAGRPRMGKTALALSIVKEACTCGKSVALFSMEMMATELVKRLIHAEGLGIEESAGNISNWNLHLFDRGGIDIDFIRSNVRLLKECDLVVIDYLGLMKLNPFKKRSEALGEVTRELKAFAMECEVPIMLLCQLNRSVESRTGYRHELSDLRESGDIEQDADKVIFIYRPEVMDLQEFMGQPCEGMAVIQKEKDRNGKSPVIYLARVNENVTQFSDWDEIKYENPF